MRPCVFVHTNHKQMIGALVSRHSLIRNSRHADRFDVRIIDAADYPFLREREGQPFLRDGGSRIWRYEDLQSFTPLRFMPPELMGYQGRAVVIDPDVFAVGDVWELLSRDMGDKAILCRPRAGQKFLEGCMASSVMVLDCAKLTWWRCREQFDELFAMQRDYAKWICLKLEPREAIGRIEDEWNDFDRLTPATKMVHNTKRQTQPWKTGLPVDFTPAAKRAAIGKPSTWLRSVRKLTGQEAPTTYRAHPDTNQERYFFGLLRECLQSGTVTEDMLRDAMRLDHVRHDAFDVLDRTPPLAA
ncbi:MAG: hypothetical protein U1E53_21325 [Dongiaceae bacterium]